MYRNRTHLIDNVASGARIFVLTLITLVPLCATSIHAKSDMPRIGFLGATTRITADYLIQGFMEGLRNHGYVEGQNIEIIWKFVDSDFDRFLDFAAELVEEEVDVIVAPSLMATLAAQFETDTIPIVFALVADPVGSGLVESMSRPGGNITGVSITSAELNAKRLELIKDTFPERSRICVLFEAPEEIEPVLMDLQVSGKKLGLHIHPESITQIDELELAFRRINSERIEGLLIPLTPLFLQNRRLIVETVNAHQIPAIYELGAFVEEGGLMSYGPNYPDSYRRAAEFVVKVLNGADPAQLPVEQPLRFELVVNEKAAKTIGVSIPASVLFRANRIIR